MRKQQVKQSTTDGTVEALPDTSVATEKGDGLKKTIDDILDDIDEVLEQNAEAFVRGYQQRGGQ